MASERIVKVTDGGEIRLYEDKENGHSYVALKAGPDLVSNYTIALPAGQGVDGNVLTSDGVGGTRWGNSDATLNTAYHTGAQISADSGQIEILKTDDTNGILIDKSAVGAGYPLRVNNDGTDSGVFIEQAGNAKALEVYQGNSNICVEVNKADSGAGVALNVINLGTGIGEVITQSGNAIALKVIQGGTANSVYVDHNDVGSSPAVRVDNAGTGAGLYVEQGGAGKGVHIVEANSENGLYVNKTDSGSGDAVAIANAGTGVGLSIAQTAAGKGLTVTQSANAIAVDIAKTTGNATCVNIDNDGTGSGIVVKQDGEWAGLIVNKTATGATVGAEVVSAGTAAALWARTSNAAGVALLADGNGENSITAQFTHDGAGTGPVISIDNSGTGEDVTGTDSSWQIGSAGRALFTGVHTYGMSLRPKTRQIASGAFAIDGTYSTIAISGEGGTDDTLDTITGAAYEGQILILIGGGIPGNITVTRTGGNIRLGAATRVLDEIEDRLMLQWDGSNWCELSFSANS